MFKSIFNAVVAVSTCFMLFNCCDGSGGGKSGNVKLSGKYKSNTSCALYPRERYPEIEFSGKSFTIFTYAWGPDSRKEYWRDCAVTFKSLADVGNDIELVERDPNGCPTCVVYKGVIKGTYSISDGKIEFVFSDGAVVVSSFSRTENTVEIDRTRFTRMQ